MKQKGWTEVVKGEPLLPREKDVRRFDGYTCPHDLDIWLKNVNDLIFDDEYVLVVEQTHAIELGLAEHPGMMSKEGQSPIPSGKKAGRKPT